MMRRRVEENRRKRAEGAAATSRSSIIPAAITSKNPDIQRKSQPVIRTLFVRASVNPENNLSGLSQGLSRTDTETQEAKDRLAAQATGFLSIDDQRKCRYDQSPDDEGLLASDGPGQPKRPPKGGYVLSQSLQATGDPSTTRPVDRLTRPNSVTSPKPHSKRRFPQSHHHYQ